jgi:hypothetical protein
MIEYEGSALRFGFFDTGLDVANTLYVESASHNTVCMAFEWLVVDKPITVIGAVSVRSGREDPVDTRPRSVPC